MIGPATTEAFRANALFEAHRDDPEFGYRSLTNEAREAGESMSERTAWRICSTNQCWSVFGKPRRGKNGKPGPPVHVGPVQRSFRSDAPRQLWLSDIERREALFNRVEVKVLHHAAVAAVG
ncbi:hypothetical protein [Nocardia salmonicida]|uniref:hypothetical protein n=1 Tax=Nocardia salmonicida TaxID=53431 RepID=UPI0033FF7F0A